MIHTSILPDGFGRSALGEAVENTVLEHLPICNHSPLYLLRWLAGIDDPEQRCLYANAAILVWEELYSSGDERAGYDSGEAWLPTWPDYRQTLGQLIRRADGTVWDDAPPIPRQTVIVSGNANFFAPGSNPTIFIQS